MHLLRKETHKKPRFLTVFSIGGRHLKYTLLVRNIISNVRSMKIGYALQRFPSSENVSQNFIFVRCNI